MKMGAIGLHNANLIDLYGVNESIRLIDVGKEEGGMYRIWIGNNEYFLLEHRRNDGFYYDRQIPRNGILIWHVYEHETNSNEQKKRSDLECPDGRYLDAGYPLGRQPDPINGGDNLDFWAHDQNYTVVHNGNQGDAFDVFDGIWYTSFGSDTNPNTYSKITKKPTGIEIFNIHQEGDTMVFDCIIPPVREPEKTPLVGLAFQRTAGVSLNHRFQGLERTLYLLNFGLSPKADALVTITEDTLIVETLTSLSYYEVQKAVEKRLLPNELSRQSSRILRRNATLDEFRDTIEGFGVRPEELGSGRAPSWVQMIYRISGESLPNTVIELAQNYPNPFNAQTNISYVLPYDGPVILEVFNILGQRAQHIDRGFERAGTHTIRLDARGLASGIYFYRLHGGVHSGTKKFTIVR